MDSSLAATHECMYVITLQACHHDRIRLDPSPHERSLTDLTSRRRCNVLRHAPVPLIARSSSQGRKRFGPSGVPPAAMADRLSLEVLLVATP